MMKSKLLWMLLTSLLTSTLLQAQPGKLHYFYLSDQRIVTVELIDAESLILNYINLSDSIAFVKAPWVVVADAQNQTYRGHLILNEDPLSPFEKYEVTELINPGEFKGYTIVGNLDFQAPPVKCFFRDGGQILELEPLTADEFDLVANRIGDLNLEMADRKAMIQQAGFYQGHGELHRSSEETFDDLSKLFVDLELLAPMLIHSPRPMLPEEDEDLKKPVIVTLECDVARSGGMFNLKVKRGVKKRIDDLAVEYVQNTWRILPAIANAKIADAKTTLNVVFDPGE
ncbi:MAG TPA: hypothetical protein VLV83_22985 [Acidobacteriota bacterium]|nr:hypothetical protein [Acidobacteriota bacterium]